jgi:hypothetical protein
MIFISYASEDFSIAERLYDLLKGGGAKVWMDKKNILPGQEWEAQIWQAATRADFFCLLLSPRSVSKRGFIRKEIRFALEKWKEKLSEDIYLIPCRIDDATPPFELQHLQYTDLRSDGDFQELAKYLTELERKLSGNQLDEYFDSFERTSIKKENENVEIQITFPLFSSPSLRKLNNAISETIRVFETEADSFDTKIPEDCSGKSFYQCGFNLFYASRDILSILFGVSWYGAGAAHPNYAYKTIKYNRTTNSEFSLQDAFTDPEEALRAISKASEFELLKRQALQGQFPNERLANWITEGTSPDWTNFENSVLHDGELLIHFAPYSVGPYMMGPQTVTLPLFDLEQLLRPNFITGSPSSLQ